MTSMLVARNTGWFRRATLHVAGKTFTIPARQTRYVGPYPQGTRWSSEGPLSVESVAIETLP